MGRRPILSTCMLLLALAASACSSTNQRGSTTVVEGLLTEDGPTAPGESVAAMPDDATGTSSAATAPADGQAPGATDDGRPASSSTRTSDHDPSDDPSPASGPTPRRGDPGSPPASSSDDVEMGRGVTQDTITIGFQSGETGSAFAAVGAALQPAYENEMAKVLVDWLNATGGIRGRQVVGVYHETETTQGTFASQAQQVCSTMTEDNDVFAVVSSAVGGDDSLAACLHDKQTPLIELNSWVWDSPYFEEYPDLYRPGHLRAEEAYRAYLEGLHANGYFEGATVGLLRFDAPVFDRLMDRVVQPTLDRLGVEPVVQEIGSPQGVGDFGAAGAQMSNAVLRFRSAGVTHVIMMENAGIMPFFFMKEAEGQGYRPRYGLSTIDAPSVQASQNDPNQQRNALAIGWSPGIDSGDAFMADEYKTAEYELCRRILTDGGVQNVAAFYAQARCDAVFLLREALETAPALTRDGLRAGVAALGDGHRSPYTIGASFSPTKRWGATTVRPLAYTDDCECYRSIGTEQRVA